MDLDLDQAEQKLQDNSVELEASFAPAEAEIGAVAKADQYHIKVWVNFLNLPKYFLLLVLITAVISSSDQDQWSKVYF